MCPCDFSQTAEIEKECFSEPWSEDQLAESLTRSSEENPNYYYMFWVADCGQQIVGYLGMVVTFGSCDITNVAVKENARNTHIGSRLLENAIAECRKCGIHEINLEVRASNGPAIGLYKKYHFTETGRRKNFYRMPTEDALLMQVQLTDRTRQQG